MEELSIMNDITLTKIYSLFFTHTIAIATDSSKVVHAHDDV